MSSACSLKIFTNSVLKPGFQVLLVVWLAVSSYVVMMWIDGIHRALLLRARVLLVVWLAVSSYVVMMWIDGIHRALLLRGVRVLVPFVFFVLRVD